MKLLAVVTPPSVNKKNILSTLLMRYPYFLPLTVQAMDNPNQYGAFLPGLGNPMLDVILTTGTS